MSENKLTAETLALHGLFGFMGYKAMEKVVTAFSFLGSTDGGITGGHVLTAVSGAVGSGLFVPVCCALCAVPLIIKLAGTIRHRYTKHREDFGGDEWYAEYVEELAHSYRKDTL
ncbi:hypothetical protein [Alicyclobacillus fastidiosus]|uniref:Uncharacterized protein n=1 Tax=Alicyclobacillus fastidiosus TaxID=392011 RepID=A0ABV5AIM6_9BACL|nr:hypothetical protein [Alicyclobacillus fastidiosus]WEH11119.1 hypothetical protein PYS47_07845 [Alicyclobacillus fastidiosus]